MGDCLERMLYDPVTSGAEFSHGSEFQNRLPEQNFESSTNEFFDNVGVERLLRLFQTDNEDEHPASILDNLASQALNNCKYYLPSEIVIPSNKIKLLHCNVRSLKNKFDQFLSFLKSINSTFDIIGLTETWLNDEIICEYNMPGYALVYNNRNDNRGGGVAMYIKNNIKFKSRPDLDFNNNIINSKFIEISNINTKNVIVGTVYRAPNSDTDSYLEYFSSMTTILQRNSNKIHFIMGDFNFDLFKLGQNNLVDTFLHSKLSNFLYPLISLPTRITSNSSTLIDNMFCNNLHGSFSGCIYSDISDHSPIFGTIESKCNPSTQSMHYYRQINDININKFKQEISSTLSLIPNDINSLKSFNNIFNNFTDTCFPIRKLSKRKTLIQPWITKGILNSIKTKDKLHKDSKQGINILYYKTYRNRLEHVKRAAKKLYFSSEIDKYKACPKKMWQTIKSIINKDTKSSTFPEHFVTNNLEITDTTVIANEFNEYFSSIGSTLNEQIPPSTHHHLSFMKPSILSSIYLHDTNEDEIIKIIKSLKTNSLFSDDIKVTILKAISSEVGQFISQAINTIFSSDSFPDFLKIATVTPIYKSGDNTHYCNYRPISVLPILSKIVERCLFDRMLSFINKNNIYSNEQFGFRKASSTSYALVDYHNHITQLLDNSEFVISIFIDLKKAFDTVNHSILLNKLYHYGMRGPCFTLLNSYLSQRYQRVKISCKNSQSTFSNFLPINCGVPQGSILGPLLFLLYINDMPNLSPSLNFILFADDTTITVSHKHLSNLQLLCNNGLEKLNNWLISNKLTINVSKTKYMLFTPKNKLIPFHPILFINNIELEQVNHIKFLGVFFDNKLSWEYHVTYLANKVAKNISILYKLRNNVPPSTMITMYYSFIYSLLSYGILLWGNSYKANTHKLLILQKRAVRIISDSTFLAHTDVLFKNKKILKLHDIVSLETLKFVYKSKLNLLPSNFDNYFNFNEEFRYSRIQIPRHRTNYRAFSIQIQGAKTYNSFNNSSRLNFTSIKTLKKYFLTSTLDSY